MHNFHVFPSHLIILNIESLVPQLDTRYHAKELAGLYGLPNMYSGLPSAPLSLALVFPIKAIVRSQDMSDWRHIRFCHVKTNIQPFLSVYSVCQQPTSFMSKLQRLLRTLHNVKESVCPGTHCA